MKRRYADGGDVAVSGSPQGAFEQSNPSYGGMNGLGNNAPLVAITNAPTAGGPANPNQAPVGMRKGGRVRTASQRADGCAIRGKTRAR